MAMRDERDAAEEAANRNSPDDLPPPRPLKHRLQITPLQLIGVPLLAFLPLLAMVGVFSDHISQVEESNQDIILQVEYPSRQRYKTKEKMRASVTLVSAANPATVTVSFEHLYLENFSDLKFVPNVTSILPDTYVVDLPAIARGETRVVEVELSGEKYWRHIGHVSAMTEAGQPVTATVDSFIIP